MSIRSIVIATLFWCCRVALAQAPSPEFEVASVRFAGSMSPGALPGVVSGGPGTSDPTRIRYHEVPFVQLVMLAYGLNTEATLINDGIVTPAHWMRGNQYEIVANVEPGATSVQVRIMLQNLLADRFGLRVHREIQKFDGWEVLIGKDGPKLQPNASPDLTRLSLLQQAPAGNGKDHFPQVPEGFAGMALHYQEGRAYLTGVGQSISDLLGLGYFRLFHYVDKTGLSDRYDFHLLYGYPFGGYAADTSLPDLTGALGQLGLKVRAAKVSIDVLIIDSAKEMPTAN